MHNKVSLNFTVESYESDLSRRIKAFYIQNHVQEAAYHGSNYCGAGYDIMRSHGISWVLNRLHLNFRSLPLWGEQVRLDTWSRARNGLLWHRNFQMFRDGEPIMNGTSADVSFVTIKSILDTKDETHYTASDYEVGLDRTTAYSMDAWFEGFYDATGNRDLRMISGYDAGAGDLDFRTGKTLAVGTYPETGSSNYYIPEEIYSWLDQHSAEYGFILRYPEGKDEYFDSTITSHRTATYRYVGIAPALYIKEHNMCLEEFLETIKGYAVDNMIIVKNGGAQYGMYYVPVNNGSPQTSFSVPADDFGYEISGNNMDGFIVTIALNESASQKFHPAPVYEDLDE